MYDFNAGVERREILRPGVLLVCVPRLYHRHEFIRGDDLQRQINTRLFWIGNERKKHEITNTHTELHQQRSN